MEMLMLGLDYEMPDFLCAGLGTPQTAGDLVWYGFGVLVTWFLWSIRDNIKNLRDEIKEEGGKREALAVEVGEIKTEVGKLKTMCEERTKHCPARKE